MRGQWVRVLPSLTYHYAKWCYSSSLMCSGHYRREQTNERSLFHNYFPCLSGMGNADVSFFILHTRLHARAHTHIHEIFYAFSFLIM